MSQTWTRAHSLWGWTEYGLNGPHPPWVQAQVNLVSCTQQGKDSSCILLHLWARLAYALSFRFSLTNVEYVDIPTCMSCLTDTCIYPVQHVPASVIITLFKCKSDARFSWSLCGCIPQPGPQQRHACVSTVFNRQVVILPARTHKTHRTHVHTCAHTHLRVYARAGARPHTHTHACTHACKHTLTHTELLIIQN